MPHLKSVYFSEKDGGLQMMLPCEIITSVIEICIGSTGMGQFTNPVEGPGQGSFLKIQCLN